jgi:hypothetical protein
MAFSGTQYTTLKPYGLPGQLYGSFAGKEEPVVLAIKTFDNAAFARFREKRSIVKFRDKRALGRQ